MSSLIKWYRVALFNLVVLTLLGLLLRYKINFPLEFVEQKKLLHAHSHFAFSGWISFLLQILLVDLFTDGYNQQRKFWDRFFLLSTIVNYGMIVTFVLQGYAGSSIVLSTASLWLGYLFAYRMNKSLPKNNTISILFIKASLFFLVLSSLGPYVLAYIIATKNTHQYWYHNALYFFLHFQYNGWFTFAVMGLLMAKLETTAVFNRAMALRFFYLLFITCFPAYLLIVMWYKQWGVITALNTATVILQAVGLLSLGSLLLKNFHTSFKALPTTCRVLYWLSTAAFILKVLLQSFSADPQLGQLAFGFRPIIIGYLHLVFLVFVSLYLIATLIERNIIQLDHPASKPGVIIFAVGVIINEVLLCIQGLASIYYIYLPWIDLSLFYNTITIVTGAVLIYRSCARQPYYTSNLQTV